MKFRQANTIEEVINLLDSLKVMSEHELRTPGTAQCDVEKAYCGKEIVVLQDKLFAAQADVTTAKSGIEAAKGNLAEEALRVFERVETKVGR